MDDLVEGLIQLMNSDGEVTGPINLGNPGEFSIRELAEQVISQTGSAVKLVYKPLPEDDPAQRQPNISQARDIPGWAPTIQLEQGPDATIKYFQQPMTSTA